MPHMPIDKRSNLMKQAASLEKIEQHWNTFCELCAGAAAMQMLIESLGAETTLVVGVDGFLQGAKIKAPGVPIIEYTVLGDIKND